MAIDFGDFLSALSEDDFDEKPVGIEEFCYSKEYLGIPPLSEHQLEILRAMTQVYKRETLIYLYGEEEGEKRWRETYKEIILQLGKGSGKDYISSIACCYIVYLLLCLKDPARYYGKPAGDSIDILNIAINAVQARNVFFKNFRTRVERCPWFDGKYIATADSIRFDKNITVHSGHSEREAWEGYNVLVVILDEISGFAVENPAGAAQAKTADDIYRMYSASVSSRFSEFGKLALLSFPRYKQDFIQQRYEKAIGRKQVILRQAKLVVNHDLPEDDPGWENNIITVEWEEDHIVTYKQERTFALKRPTWDINPTKKISDFTKDFYDDYEDALSRFACMPPDSIDGFFKNREKLENAFRHNRWMISDTGDISPDFLPDPTKRYYMHVDLAEKIDRCVVAIAHVEGWVEIKIGSASKQILPRVVVDAIRYWTPSSTQTVDFSDVKQFILDIHRMGFPVGLVTFDRWNSRQIMDELGTYGIKTERLSVAKPHYQDLALAIVEERVEGPDNQILIAELLSLRVKRDKIDHPPGGSKDLADAVCGAVYNAVAHTPPNLSRTVEISTYSAPAKKQKVEEPPPHKADQPMPRELEEFLANLKVI